MQGVIKSYDPVTRAGVVVRDTDRSEYDLAADALRPRPEPDADDLFSTLADAGPATAGHRSSGPLVGVPLAVKDNLDTADFSVGSAGSCPFGAAVSIAVGAYLDDAGSDFTYSGCLKGRLQ